MDWSPANRGEFGILPGVAFGVLCELVRPPSLVVLRKHAMLWTCVPEAAVHKHGQTRAGKDDIGSTRKIAAVDPEAEAAGVEFPAECQFRFCRGPGHAAHLCRYRSVLGERASIVDIQGHQFVAPFRLTSGAAR